jgi:ABC-type branched-subunit amino acid transport system ATPase component
MPTSQVSDSTARRVEPYLEVVDVAAGYGAALIVAGASVSVGRGEIATIVGPNGSGKSTLLKAITGDLPAQDGTVRLGGQVITNRRRDQLVRLGLRLVPQEEVVFNSLTVRENLEMGGYLLRRRQVGPAVDRVLDTFPALRPLHKSIAGRLSGGERKLVAIGRVLMSEPTIVILDEPSASLSPSASEMLLSQQVPALARSGAAVLLVEQRAVQALRTSDWAYVMVAGRIELSAPAAEVLGRGDIGELFLGRRAGDEDPRPNAGVRPSNEDHELSGTAAIEDPQGGQASSKPAQGRADGGWEQPARKR